jgi:trigger factor
MKVKVEDAGACRRVLKVEVDIDVVTAEYEKVAEEYSQVARIPGFRKGKAPASLVEKHYSKEVAEETRNRLVPKLYREALDSEKIEPVAIVGVTDVLLDKGSPMSFTVTVDIQPKFKLPRYKSIAIKGKLVTIADADVDKAMDQLREASATFEDVEGRAVKNGDMVKIDFTASCEEKPLVELSADAKSLGLGSDFWMIVGENELIPGLSEGLIGAEIDTSRNITVRFPVGYRVAELSGKNAEYEVTIKALREKKLGPLGDEVLKAFEVDTEDALRVEVHSRLLKRAEEEEKQRQKNEITRVLLEKCSVEAPESLVEEETKRAVQGIVMENMQRGVPKEEIEKNRAEIESTALESSRERVKLGYVLDAIAVAEDIAVDDAEMEARLDEMATYYGMEKPKLREEMEKRDSLDDLKRSVRAEKTLDYLLGRAKIKTK